LIADFHSKPAADEAEEDFIRRFRNKETPEEVEEQTVASNPEGWDLSQLLVTVGLAASKAEARRLIQQGGVSVDGERQTVGNPPAMWRTGTSCLIKVGKRRFVRVRFT
jgi:tyrosyl-tRNA synthetase